MNNELWTTLSKNERVNKNPGQKSKLSTRGIRIHWIFTNLSICINLHHHPTANPIALSLHTPNKLPNITIHHKKWHEKVYVLWYYEMYMSTVYIHCLLVNYNKYDTWASLSFIFSKKKIKLLFQNFWWFRIEWIDNTWFQNFCFFDFINDASLFSNITMSQ